MNATSTYPEQIHVRRMDFEWKSDIPADWAQENPLLTALMAGLSAAFPPGERYFIDSVRHFADQVTDPVLKERIRGFTGQEANHTKEHLAFNAFLDARGLPIGKMQRFVEKEIKKVKESSSPESNLARTVALEHMTAFLATALLENPEVFDHTHPTIAGFWAWHAIEEIEHRSVAFDVYKHCVDDETLRIRIMAEVTVLFWLLTGIRTLIILRKTGHLLDVSSWATGLNLLLGRPGILRKAFPLYRAYYKRDFHPDQHDSTSVLREAKRRYLGAT